MNKPTLKFSMMATAICFLTLSLNGQVFVDVDATGSNDGSSWANAYNDLSDALDNAPVNSEIWVAEGTYLPGRDTATRNSFFSLPHDLVLYGGFGGDEAILGERSVEDHETILSGDLLQDDLDLDFDNKREDNCKHVMWVTANITTASRIDGFTIRNGHTEPDTGAGDDRRSGGILCYGAPVISNCTFLYNYGYFGGGLYPRGSGAANIVIDNCLFKDNRGGFGAGMYNNATNGGLTNCRFESNMSSSSGGAIYLGSEQGIMVADCEFIANSTNSRGGAIYIASSPSHLLNCTFTDNEAPTSTGGAVHINTFDDDPASTVSIANCTFTGGLATWGGAVSCYGDRTLLVITGSQMSGNTAVNNGGAIHNGFGAHISINDCAISKNEANRGGAFNSQNDSVVITFNRTSIVENASSGNGGAITVVSDNEVSNRIPEFTLNKVIMSGNLCAVQGAGADISNANVRVTNSLIAANFNTGDGAGGGFSFNASDSFNMKVKFTNSTVVDNYAVIGAGVSQWTGGELGRTTMELQNTIFDNPDGLNYLIEDGQPEVFSWGGNLSSDETMEELVHALDLVETDPDFVDRDNGDYSLLNSSPCVNHGVGAGAPDDDILGNRRVGIRDQGAYENQNVTSVFNTAKPFGNLKVRQSDVNEFTWTFDDVYTGDLDVVLRDVNGNTIQLTNYSKSSNLIKSTEQVSVPSGVYLLTITDGKRLSTKAFAMR